MTSAASALSRPFNATLFTGLLALSAVVMIWVGSMAAGYYIPAIALLVEAALLWLGKGKRLFEAVLLINQVSGLILILDLWLGGGLGESWGDLKLDISGVMLLTNLAFGGPLLSLLAVPLLALLRFGQATPAWFARA
jgi:hypothetical protein